MRGLAVGARVLGLTGSGTASADESVGQPSVAAALAVDAQSRTATITVGEAPSGAAVDPTTHIAWVVNETVNSISVIQR